MEKESEFASEFNLKYSPMAKKVLRLISNDSRAKLTDIAKALNISRRTASLKLENLEKELKIHYTIEFNEEKLGLRRQHLVIAKFKNKPSYNKIAELLKKSYIPQMAASIEGTYDLLIYANALSGTEYAHWDRKMQMLLSEYGVEWQTSEVVHRQLGFFPIRNEAIMRADIKDRYKKMLILLNENSRISFQEMSKSMKMNVNTIVYNFNKMLKLGYINSFTITMDMPKNVSFMTFFSKYIPSAGYEDASAIARKVFMSDEEFPLISRYLVTAPLIGSFDFFTLGAFDNPEIAYKKDVLHHKNLFKKYAVKMLYGNIKDVLVGRLPIRSIDTKTNYKTIIWNVEQD
jgi:DNA-binding Lrp family transcriptional regulator